MHAFNPSTQEAEAGGFLSREQPGLQSELQDSRGYTEKPCLEKTKQKRLFVGGKARVTAIGTVMLYAKFCAYETEGRRPHSPIGQNEDIQVFPFMVVLFVCLFVFCFFETGFLCIALAVLELTL